MLGLLFANYLFTYESLKMIGNAIFCIIAYAFTSWQIEHYEIGGLLPMRTGVVITYSTQSTSILLFSSLPVVFQLSKGKNNVVCSLPWC